MASVQCLGSVRQIGLRLEPREYRTGDTETGTKTVDEGGIDGVKGCTKIQRHKQGRGTKV